MSRRTGSLGGLTLMAVITGALAAAPLQGQVSMPDLVLSGQDASPDEMEAFAFIEAGSPIRAREKASEILAANTKSFVAHLVLGRVQNEAEGSFPRARFHFERALSLYESRYGKEPGMDQPWRWHALLLRQLALVHGHLERYSDRLAYIARFNELYEPDMIAERAWPLMKLGRYEEAKLASELAMSLEARPDQRTIALNALCAIEFEAGRDGASYTACKRAVDDARKQGGSPSSVDLTNLAESSRSLFKLDEAERIAMEATRAPVSWYGNPWLELAELYTRQGRFMDALAALREIPDYRALRPPHVRDADKNETRRALSAFLLTTAHTEEAIVLTEQAMYLHDRRAHSSRDVVQDHVVAALLDRRARLSLAEHAVEQASAAPFYQRVAAAATAAWHRLSAWHSGLVVTRLLSSPEHLTGTFRIGTASAAVMPPWLLGELVDVLGPAVVRAAVKGALAEDKRRGASAYYESVLSEAELKDGSPGQARELAASSLRGLSSAEALVRARLYALSAEAARRSGDVQATLSHWDSAFQIDPGIVRRLSLAIPVRITAADGPVAAEVASALGRSPRLRLSDAGLSVRVESDGSSGSVCLLGQSDAVLGCGRAARDAGDDRDALIQKVVAAFHDEVFSPRVSLSRADINSLDGTNLVGRQALDDALSE